MSDQYVQDPLFYTESEMIAEVSKSVSANLERALRAVQENIQTVLRDTDVVDRETAVALYNEIADYYGWDHMTALNTYTVEVTYGGNLIGTFSVEAEDDDTAIDEVQTNMEAEGTMTLSLSYNDQEVSGEVYLDGSDLCEFFEYRAWEEQS